MIEYYTYKTKQNINLEENGSLSDANAIDAHQRHLRGDINFFLSFYILKTIVGVIRITVHSAFNGRYPASRLTWYIIVVMTMAIRSDQSHLSAGETRRFLAQRDSRQKDKVERWGGRGGWPEPPSRSLRGPLRSLRPSGKPPRGPSPLPFPTKRGWFMGSTAAPLYVFSFISQLPHGRRGESEQEGERHHIEVILFDKFEFNAVLPIDLAFA